MPARVVDGEGLWRSKKLKRVPVMYRAEYANLIPLAEANGVFECDPEHVWADVYAFNRTEVTPEIVALILYEMEKADLLVRWEVDGKRYGYWVGIGKSGRLPAGAHRERYKNLPPNPPDEILSGTIRDNPGQSGNMPAGFGIGLVLDRIGVDGETENQPNPQIENPENGQEEELKIKKEIPVLCRMILRVSAENHRDVWEEMELRARNDSVGGLMRDFTEWANANKYENFNGKPIRAFLRSLEKTEVSTQKQAASDPIVKNLARELAYLSDNRLSFDDRAKANLSVHLDEGYTPEEIAWVFKHDFIPSVLWDDAKKVSYAALGFSQSADQYVYSLRRKKSESLAQAASVGATRVRLEQEAAALRDQHRAQRAAEEELVEDSLDG